MCGIFGFIGIRPNVDWLKRLAVANEARGPEAFGLAWLDRGGRCWWFKQEGSPFSYLRELDRCKNSVAVIGHCRMATHGDPKDNRNNHPFRVGQWGLLVHNGVIWNYEELAKEFGVRLETECDSEIIAKLTEKFLSEGKDELRSVKEAMEQLRGSAAVLVLFPWSGLVVWGSKHQQLYWGRAPSGVYWSSVPVGGMLEWHRCKMGVVGRWKREKKLLKHDWAKMKAMPEEFGGMLRHYWGDSYPLWKESVGNFWEN